MPPRGGARLPVLLRSIATGLLALAAGCAEGVPSWAMHVKPGSVDPDATTEQVAATLRGELQDRGAGLPPGHLAPEQIASVALREMAEGHQVDATLWLSMASYRYHQEAGEAILRGGADLAHPAPGVNRRAMSKLVNAEISRYADLNFADEITALRHRVYGRNEIDRALREQLAALGKATPMEQEALRDALWQLRPASADAERSRYPQLADLFLRRLRADFAAVRQDEHPGLYLARTPIAALQREAAQNAVSFFEPTLCAALADAFPPLRPSVVALLASPRPEARANAAAVLAMAPSQDTRAALEARLAVETDPRTKLVLEFALVHHGLPEHAASLSAALQSCAGPACTLPIMLARWLPRETRAALDQQLLARIAAGNQYEPKAHLFVAALLRDVGRAKPLDPAAVEALIVAARRRNNDYEEHAAVAAFEAVGDTAALSRDDVLKRIRTRAGTSTAEQQDVLRPGALLARLAKVAAAPDLPLIFRLMDRFGTTAGPEPHAIVEAALHVPGRGAEDGLIRWFDRYEKLQIHIAIGLIARSSFPRDELDQLIARGAARTQMIAKTIQHAPDAQATLLRYLRGDDIGDKLAAAQLAGITEQASARADLLGLLTFEDARYYPNDALIRHAAMTSLLRIGLATSRPSAAAAAGAEVTEPAGEAPPAAPATPPSGTGESAPRSP